MRLVATMFLLCFLNHLEAQDIHFTQYYNAPTIVNPASTGLIEGNHRLLLGIHYRQSNVLRGDSFTAGVLSYDGRVRISDNGSLGLGVAGVADKAGELNFGSEQSKYLASYIHTFGEGQKYSHLSFGIDLGITKRTVDINNARWASQIIGGTGILPPTSFNADFFHADFGAGMVWSSVLGSRKNFTVGVAAHHLNRANISFYGEQANEKLTVRYTLHGDAQFSLASKLSLLPYFMYLSQGDFYSINTGIALRFHLNGAINSIDLRQLINYVRSPYASSGEIDAYHVMANLNFKKLLVGLSYGRSAQNLRAFGVFTYAFEVMLGYTFNRSSKMRPTLEETKE